VLSRKERGRKEVVTMPVEIEQQFIRREEREYAGEVSINVGRVKSMKVGPVFDDEDHESYPENYYRYLKIETEHGDTVEIRLTAVDPELLHLKQPQG
jgi:hypothetical protein